MEEVDWEGGEGASWWSFGVGVDELVVREWCKEVCIAHFVNCGSGMCFWERVKCFWLTQDILFGIDRESRLSARRIVLGRADREIPYVPSESCAILFNVSGCCVRPVTTKVSLIPMFALLAQFMNGIDK